ncbi:hypothetical protein VMCG_08640 [Cytospora schulzeri]|uniref:Uncharacterized protein n=1 Tax=Cytospora schulzeri TaxID=448051 RepID=A0A423VT73_9PEZI|nr:hypothetical protein VMCG_08640 [Valsa malicola]
MSGSVFSETLQEITNTKLDELSKRRASFEEAKSSMLSSVQSKPDPIERLALLIDGVKKCFAIKTQSGGNVIKGQTKHPRLETQLQSLDRFLAQARHDPSVSMRALADWEKGLLGHLDSQSLRFQYASLYGELVTEWLSESGDKKGRVGADAMGEHGNGEGEDFEDVGSAAKLKSRSEWESTVFEPAGVDIGTLLGYLDSLFGRDGSSVEDETSMKKRQALNQLRQDVEAFEAELASPDQFREHNLKWTIQGLLSSDILTNEKREVLKDFMGSPVILSEIADVLNMRFSALGSWNWGPGGVPVEQRRKINGVFSIHMHEDLLQAIFLQYIGVKWSVFFKSAFNTVRNTRGAWTSLDKEIPELELRRLEYYLGPINTKRSLQKTRQSTYSRDYFVAKLLRKDNQVPDFVDGEVEAEYDSTSRDSIKRKRRSQGQAPRLQLASRAARRSDAVCGEDTDRRYTRSLRAEAEIDEGDEEDDEDEENEEIVVKNPMQLKQQLLHLLSTEMAINTRLHGELSVFHAMFKDWDILLPHETIRTVLEFFGISSTWLEFFTKYLQAPLQFADGGDASKVRRRGVPSSHVLSDVFSETVLFCLDMAVNQVADGQPLWRYEGDLWFWSADQQITIKTWATVENFASLTATSINEDKSGSVRITRAKDNDTPMDEEVLLPQGEIRWGFLVLSPETGRFEIDQAMVDLHIAELGQQLKQKKHSIFAFIQTWNTYAATFFSSNFGTSANCFGRHHVDDMLATHKRIQQQIFSPESAAGLGSASSIVDYLKKTIEQRFNVTDIPDGYLYFPVDLGGLDLRSPFISLLQIRDSVLESHDSLFEKMFEAEREAYRDAKALFERGAIMKLRKRVVDPTWQPESQEDRENFLGWDEFIRYREALGIVVQNRHPVDVFSVRLQLMQNPAEQSVDPDISSQTHRSLCQLKPGNGPIMNTWLKMSPYWRWVTVMYGPEIVARFGGLSIVDAGLLPMGMVGLFREKRVTWKD